MIVALLEIVLMMTVYRAATSVSPAIYACVMFSALMLLLSGYLSIFFTDLARRSLLDIKINRFVLFRK